MNSSRITIAIVSVGRSHLLNLARELNKKSDLDVCFYTIVPRSRCRKFGYTGKVCSCFLPIGVLSILSNYIPFRSPYARDSWNNKLRTLFDKYVAWKLKRCDILIGLNGNAVASSIKAREKYNAITICDQGSSHILQQNSVRHTYSDVEPDAFNTDYMIKHYSAADYLMAPSIYVRKSDIDNGIPEGRILYNPYGVNLNIFKAANNPGCDSFDVIMVGSWWKHKGCDLLANACINILGVSLLHVGYVIDCELPDSPLFKHVDFIPEHELPNYYAQAKVFAIPSRDEGLALVQLQAAACGLPVVGSTRSGVLDLSGLLNDTTHYIAAEEPLTAETIAAAIKTVLARRKETPIVVKPGMFDSLSWEAYGVRYYNQIKTILRNT